MFLIFPYSLGMESKILSQQYARAQLAFRFRFNTPILKLRRKLSHDLWSKLLSLKFLHTRAHFLTIDYLDRSSPFQLNYISITSDQVIERLFI